MRLGHASMDRLSEISHLSCQLSSSVKDNCDIRHRSNQTRKSFPLDKK